MPEKGALCRDQKDKTAKGNKRMRFVIPCVLITFICMPYASSCDETETERSVRTIFENPKLWASGRAKYLIYRKRPSDLSPEDDVLTARFTTFFEDVQNNTGRECTPPYVPDTLRPTHAARCALWCAPKPPTDPSPLTRNDFVYCLRTLAKTVTTEGRLYQVRVLYKHWSGDVAFGVTQRSCLPPHIPLTD